ncbi:MAG: type II toxin-antitoxin system HicB family antitoxin [Dehalococcoidia bacterium]|nr:type II toxin-antitoxin system HicB family antitoxin [Dehalococcoidia bacterium]
MSYRLTSSVWQEDDLYVARCVELGVASQGCSEEEALSNLKEAVELYLEQAST